MRNRLRMSENDRLLFRRTIDELDALIPPAMTREEAKEVATKLLHPEETSRYSGNDVASWVEDALGRFIDVPAHMLKFARTLCRTEDQGGGQVQRYRINGDPDRDIIVVEHPTPIKTTSADGFEMEVPRHIVFGRRCLGDKRQCFTCDNAKRRGQEPKQHVCWKYKPYLEWVPEIYYKGWSPEDAEEVALELKRSWEAEREQELEGWSSTEISFSNDYLESQESAWRQAGAWTSMARVAQPGE